jgi:hypothetical protein
MDDAALAGDRGVGVNVCASRSTRLLSGHRRRPLAVRRARLPGHRRRASRARSAARDGRDRRAAWGGGRAPPANRSSRCRSRALPGSFWRQCRQRRFGADAGVLFDCTTSLSRRNRDNEAWRCWRDGAGARGWTTRRRDAGAGRRGALDRRDQRDPRRRGQYAATLSRWLEHRPTDPAGNLAASWHVYNFSWCSTPAAGTPQAAPVAARVPLVLGELGRTTGGAPSSARSWTGWTRGSRATSHGVWTRGARRST